MINLLYCGNKLMFDGILLSLLSSAKVTKDSLNVLILTGDFHEIDPVYVPFTEIERAFFEGVIKKYNPASQVRLLDETDTMKNELPREKNFFSKYTPYSLMKVFFDLFPAVPSKSLYLDADTIVIHDLSTFYNSDLHGKDIGLVLDNLRIIFFHPFYLNSGVMLLDMDKIRHDGAFGRCRNIIAAKKLKHPDQDAINKVFRKEKKVQQYLRDYNEQRKVFPSTVIRHFTPELFLLPYPHTVNIKPWQIEDVHTVYKDHQFDALYKEHIALKKDYAINGYKPNK